MSRVPRPARAGGFGVGRRLDEASHHAMSAPVATIARPLHDEDLHAWALDQAARLRDLAKQRPNEPID